MFKKPHDRALESDGSIVLQSDEVGWKASVVHHARFLIVD